MLLATLATLAFMGATSLNLMLVIAAIAVGGAVAWVSGKRVAMTDMPQMIALYNGMGGGAAAAIAAVELYRGGETNARASDAWPTAGGIHRRGVLQRQPHRLRQAAGPDHQVGALRRPEDSSIWSFLLRYDRARHSWWSAATNPSGLAGDLAVFRRARSFSGSR